MTDWMVSDEAAGAARYCAGINDVILFCDLLDLRRAQRDGSKDVELAYLEDAVIDSYRAARMRHLIVGRLVISWDVVESDGDARLAQQIHRSFSGRAESEERAALESSGFSVRKTR